MFLLYSTGSRNFVLTDIKMETDELIKIMLELTSAQGIDDLFDSLSGIIRRCCKAENVYVYEISRNRELNHNTGEPCMAALNLSGNGPDIEDIESDPDILRYYSSGRILINSSRDGLVNEILFPMAEASDDEYIIRIGAFPEGGLKSGSISVLQDILVISNNQLKLMKQKDTDYLTGLLNRQALSRALARISAGSESDNRREGVNYSRLAIFDIDHFKDVNDKFGHMIGDEVLILFSRMLRQEMRFHDLKFRFGGEEFIILMREVDEKKAMMLLERIRANVESRTFPIVGRITVSAGFAGIHPEEHSTIIIDRADRALYYAKNHGRNMVCSYEELVQKKLIEPVRINPPRVIIF